MKKPEIDKIPEWWPVCQNDGCPMEGECLRQLARKELLYDATRWMSVLPSALKDGECQYFQKAETVRMVRGLHSTFKNLRDKNVRHNLRIDLTGYFGSKGSFYRYKDGERWMNPQLQQMIADYLKSYGCDDEPVFDEYAEGYDFTQLPTEQKDGED